MSPSATLDPQAAGVLERIEQDGEQRYRDLVLKMTDGKTPEPAELREALLGSGRSRDDLTRHLARAREQKEAVEDLEHAKEIQATLPELQAANDAADADAEQLREKHRQALTPKLETQHKTHAALDAAKREARSLERESMQILGSGKAESYTLKWQQLSTLACKSHTKLLDERMWLGKHESELDLAVSDRDHWQRELDRVEEINGAENARENFGSRRAKAVGRIESLEKKISEIRDLEKKHQKAESALEDFETKNFTDWRQMKFD